MMSIETALTTADLWSPPPPGTPAPPSSDTERFAVWLIRTRGDPEWNPDRADHAMPAWRDEMTRLISVYQRSRAMDDARRAAIHHAKLMHRPRGHSSRQTHAPSFTGSGLSRQRGAGYGDVCLVDGAPGRVVEQNLSRGLIIHGGFAEVVKGGGKGHSTHCEHSPPLLTRVRRFMDVKGGCTKSGANQRSGGEWWREKESITHPPSFPSTTNYHGDEPDSLEAPRLMFS